MAFLASLSFLFSSLIVVFNFLCIALAAAGEVPVPARVFLLGGMVQEMVSIYI